MILYNLRRFSLSFLLILSALALNAQVDYEDEGELKKGAEKLFEEKKFIEASPLYSQLVSLYPKDPNYAYKYGACLIYASEDPKESLNFLEFAVSKPEVDPQAYFYLGRAYHINFRFNQAISSYEKFKLKAKGKTLKEFDADGMIQMCENGKTLLRNISDLVVYDKKQSTREDFFRAYNLEEYGGQLIVKPEELMSDYEKKEGIKSIVFLPKDAQRVYFSKIEAKSETGRDIYYADRTEDGFGKHIKLDSRVNTNKYDDFPFIHPSGKVLYFASKGHNSMGGYDIFRSFLNEETGYWEEPVNMDFAINTPYDDFLMITNEAQDRAFFATNRYSKLGRVNVVNIATQRIPVDYAVVKGDFISPSTKNAKITVEDMYSNQTLGTFETNSSGEYSFKLPSSGRFRFLVEEENSMVTHAGVVELKQQNTFKPLFQKMEIVKEGDDEKLIITNLLDEELPDEQLPLTVEMFQDQADLKVNYEDKAPQLIVQNDPQKPQGPQLEIEEETAEANKNAASSGEPIESEDNVGQNEVVDADPNDISAMVDVGALLTTATKFESEFNNKANSFQKQADLAQKDADKFTDLAQNELAQIGQLSAGPNAQEEDIVKEIEALQKEAEKHQEQASSSSELASLYSEKATTYREKAETAKSQKETLQSAQSQNQSINELEYADEVHTALNELQPTYQNSTSQPGNAEVYAELFTDLEEEDQLIEEKQQYIDDLTPAIKADETKLAILKQELEGTTKKKRIKELEEEIATLEETIAISKQEVIGTNKGIELAQNQKTALSSQFQLASNYDKAVNTQKSDEDIELEFATAVKSSGIPPQKAVQAGAISSMGALAKVETSNPELAEAATSTNAESNATNSTNTSSQPGEQAASSTSSNQPQKLVLTPENVDLSSIETAEYKNYNFESKYNEEFFLPVPDGAEFPLTASTDGGPAPVVYKVPDPVSPAELPTEVEYSGQFVSLIQGADTIQDEVLREKTKGDLLDKWSYKLDTEIFLLKEKRRKATSDKRKETLTQEITALETQQSEIKFAANKTYERLSYQQNGELAAEANNDAFMQTQLEYQSLSNVMKTSYNKENQASFSDLGEVENDFVRLFKVAEINEKWISDLETEINDLEKLAVAEPDPNKQRIIQKRISSLIQLKGRKQNELELTNQSVVEYAFQNPADNVPVVSSGVTKARANYLAVQSQKSLVNSIMLSDSANKVSDAEQKNQLITQANAEYEKSKQLANQSSEIYTALAWYSSSPTQSVTFDSEEDLKTADVNQILADLNKPKPQENASAQSDLNNTLTDDFKVSLNAMVGEPSSAQASKFLVNNKKTELTTIAYAIANVKDQLENETDPEKKLALEQELALLVAERRIVEAQVNAANRKADLLSEAQANATSNPQKNEDNVKKLLKEAETLNQLGADSIQYASNLRNDAELASGEEKQRMLKQAALVEKRANANVEAAKDLVKLAEQIKRVEKTALVKNQLQTTVSDFNFPTTDKVLTEAEVKELSSTEEFAEFQNLKGDYQRMIKQAEVMYSESDAKRKEAEKLFDEANELRKQAAEATTSEERERLFKEAEVRENEAKAKLKEAEQMEVAAVELSQNAIGKKKELEAFVANLSPALAAKLVAFDKKSVEGGSYGGVLADVTQGGASNSGNNNAVSTPTGTVTAESVKGSQFYVNDDAGDSDVKYNPTTKSIFKIGDTNTPYYNDAQPIQFNPELPSGLVYKVQIGAFSKRIDPGVFRGFAPITAENAGANLIRYTAGLFEGFNPADAAKNEIRKLGYADAFVVAYYNGKRISAADARDMVNLAGAQIANISGVASSPSSSATGAGSSAIASASNNNTTVSTGSPISIEGLPPTPARNTPVAEVQSASNPQVTDMSNLAITYYTVQIGVFSKPVTAADLKNITPIQVYRTNSGFYRYNSGVFDNINDAIAAKNKIVGMGISDAFVTAYENKQRVTPEQAQSNISSGNAPAANQPKPPANLPTQTTPSRNQTGANQTNVKPNVGQILFRVQVGAYENDIPVEQAKAILKLTSYGVDIDESQAGLIKYLVGNFKGYQEALDFKDQMDSNGLSDAFVIALQNGKRISVEDANNLLNQ